MAKPKTMLERHNEIKQRITKLGNDKQHLETKLQIDRDLIWREFLDEMNSTGSIRSETLLMYNYIENLLKDIITLQLESEMSRRIAKKTIVTILEENGTLNSYFAHDIRMIFQIRDLFAHNLRKSIIETEIPKILKIMFTTEHLIKEFAKNPKVANWEDRELHIQLSDIGIYIINKIQEDYKNVMVDYLQNKQKKIQKNP